MTPAIDLEKLSADDLWKIYNEVRALLKQRMTEERQLIDERMRQLGPLDFASAASRPSSAKAKFSSKARSSSRARSFSKAATAETKKRRSYPKVKPQYRNPDNESETWSGRGNRPRWLTSQIEAGKDIGIFRISADRKKDQHPGASQRL